MNLIDPGVGSDPGPNYAIQLNQSLSLIDQHDHSFGKGVQITPSGININSTLPLNNNVLSGVQAVVLQAQGSAITSLQSLSAAPGSGGSVTDLFFTDGSGNTIQITKSGIVNSTAATIPGESYSAGTFTWTQTQSSLPTTPANFDIGSITLRPNTAATTQGITLTPPSTGSYSINFPTTVPASQKIVTLDNSGNLEANYDVDNSTLTISSNTIKVANNGITSTQIANNTITTNQISNSAGITKAQLATNVLQYIVTTFSSSGTFTVPANVNNLIITGAGGGGGGGGGGANTTGGGGAAGGAGATPDVIYMSVTPADVLTITIGTAGAGGAASSTSGSGGSAGTDGGNSIAAVTGSGAKQAFFPGGHGGEGGGIDTTAVGPTTTFKAGVSFAGVATPSGIGAGSGSAGTAGGTNYTSSTASTGGGASNGGGGGGGGGGFGPGGNGGAGGNAGIAGQPGVTATNFGAGGGGGGGSGPTGPFNNGGNGGNGGGGYITIAYLG